MVGIGDKRKETNVSCCSSGVLIVAVRSRTSGQLLRQLHWLKARERIDFLLVLIVYTSVITEQQRRYLADELRQQANLDVVYVPLHRRRWLFAVLGSQLSTPGRRRLEQSAAASCMSRLRHHCLSSVAAWRHISTLDCTYHSYCCAQELTRWVISDTTVVHVNVTVICYTPYTLVRRRYEKQ